MQDFKITGCEDGKWIFVVQALLSKHRAVDHLCTSHNSNVLTVNIDLVSCGSHSQCDLRLSKHTYTQHRQIQLSAVRFLNEINCDGENVCCRRRRLALGFPDAEIRLMNCKGSGGNKQWPILR